MPDQSVHHCDILVAGAGFAGSLTALVLHNIGFKVCLVEKGQHPRFAIGESSTPVADMILRELSSKYNLPWLFDFSRYGSWQRSHPEVVCGLKRGFSFFKHCPGKAFTTDANHKNELLVAASSDDMQSDTNWLRSDFDAFLVGKVKEAGIPYFDRIDIISGKRNTQWEFHTSRAGGSLIIHASFLIDATGGGDLLDNIVGVKSTTEGFLTDSFAVFSHFTGVPRWVDMLRKSGIPTGDFPYDPDNSALHQILDEGWLWMLRFNDERTSLGFVLDNGKCPAEGLEARELWNSMLEKYPSVNDSLKNTALALQPGKLIKSGRLQRKTEKCFGPGWVALPHTAGFVDPLFSTGIAHSLAGIERIADIFRQHYDNAELLCKNLEAYEEAVFEEIKLIDQLVAGCYKTMKHFELFNAWSMLYFASTIAYEQRRLKGKPPGYFLGADDRDTLGNIQECYLVLLKILDGGHPAYQDTVYFTSLVREKIAPVNIAGLLDPSLKNMYRHTVAVL